MEAKMTYESTVNVYRANKKLFLHSTFVSLAAPKILRLGNAQIKFGIALGFFVSLSEIPNY